MQPIGSILAAQARLGMLYADRLLKDIPADRFARLARPGGVMVQSNHPAWVLGHLCIYPVQVCELVGSPTPDAVMPPKYAELFKNGVECRDDERGDLYPPMAELIERFTRSYTAAIATAAAAADAVLLRPNPAEGRMRELFPTVGAAIAFYIGGHVQQHLGQLSAWRRMQGLPPA